MPDFRPGFDPEDDAREDGYVLLFEPVAMADVPADVLDAVCPGVTAAELVHFRRPTTDVDGWPLGVEDGGTCWRFTTT